MWLASNVWYNAYVVMCDMIYVVMCDMIYNWSVIWCMCGDVWYDIQLMCDMMRVRLCVMWYDKQVMCDTMHVWWCVIWYTINVWYDAYWWCVMRCDVPLMCDMTIEWWYVRGDVLCDVIYNCCVIWCMNGHVWYNACALMCNEIWYICRDVPCDVK